MNTLSQARDMLTRLSRMETRMVEGFLQLGVNIKQEHAESIRVDTRLNTVYIANVGVSILAIASELPTPAAYDVLCGDKYICTISKESL